MLNKFLTDQEIFAARNHPGGALTNFPANSSGAGCQHWQRHGKVQNLAGKFYLSLKVYTGFTASDLASDLASHYSDKSLF